MRPKSRARKVTSVWTNCPDGNGQQLLFFIAYEQQKLRKQHWRNTINVFDNYAGFLRGGWHGIFDMSGRFLRCLKAMGIWCGTAEVQISVESRIKKLIKGCLLESQNNLRWWFVGNVIICVEISEKFYRFLLLAWSVIRNDWLFAEVFRIYWNS